MSGRHEHPHRFAKRTPVRDIDHYLDIGPTVVQVDAPLVDVARLAISQPRTRLISVVDAEGRLVGVLPVLRVVEELVVRLSPEELMKDIVDLESAGRFGREVGAQVAGDLMSEPVFLRPDSTVADAFRAMHLHRYSGLPVVDDERRVSGYIDLLELALRYLDELPPGVPVDAAAADLQTSVADEPAPDERPAGPGR
ncbi:MAG TPA: CBS domain-containing protein [Candidatus Limnocylindrales bacterium]|nr:CBS domain-containing protein [Candidatus Limnocylindrales bacterium]